MPLPGMRGTDHIGFTVPDLDEAERFFVDIIGCKRVYALGPFERDDDWMSTQLNVHPRSVIRENRHFRDVFTSSK
jgi:catechol 2,3-dioxygenase-like lactoylglutathione lyase family enzyme